MGHWAFKENKSLGETMSKTEIEEALYQQQYQQQIEAVKIATGEYPVTTLIMKYENVTTSGSYPDSTFKYIFSGECTNFQDMFHGCTGLTKVSDLDTHNGWIFAFMFYNCTSLTEINDLDIHNGFNFSNMFNGCTSLTHLQDSPYAPEGSRWQFNDNVNLGDCPLDRESILKVFNGLQTVSNKTITISSTTNSYLSAADKAIATDKGWTVSVQS